MGRTSSPDDASPAILAGKPRTEGDEAAFARIRDELADKGYLVTAAEDVIQWGRAPAR